MEYARILPHFFRLKCIETVDSAKIECRFIERPKTRIGQKHIGLQAILLKIGLERMTRQIEAEQSALGTDPQLSFPPRFNAHDTLVRKGI